MIHPHDPSSAPGPSVSESTTFDEWETIEDDYRCLLVRGLSPIQAGNVAAYIAGLHAVEGGWTVEEIKDLVALRAFVAGPDRGLRAR